MIPNWKQRKKKNSLLKTKKFMGSSYCLNWLKIILAYAFCRKFSETVFGVYDLLIKRLISRTQCDDIHHLGRWSLRNNLTRDLITVCVFLVKIYVTCAYTLRVRLLSFIGCWKIPNMKKDHWKCFPRNCLPFHTNHIAILLSLMTNTILWYVSNCFFRTK